MEMEHDKSTKFLGAMIDDNLDGGSWNCRTKKYISTTSLVQLYNAFIFPCLTSVE